MFKAVSTGFLLALCCAPAVVLSQDPSRDDGILHCQAEGDSVHLRWQIEFIRPIDGWLIVRDGARIDRVGGDVRSYVDRDVPVGEHFYELLAIDGDVISRMGHCSVVSGDFGIRCRADGLDVEIQWGPILIDIAIDAFLIRENGVIIDRVPADVRSYNRTVPRPGGYRYIVSAVTGGGDAEFVIGACTVRARNPHLVCEVDPPVVFLRWTNQVFPAIPHFFQVFVDGVFVGNTGRQHFQHEPGPGEHRYCVYVVFGPQPIDDIAPAGVVGDPDIVPVDPNRDLVGCCSVVLPGEGPPPPEDLTCVDLDAPPEFDDVLGDDELLAPHDILLVWQIPHNVAYDFVVIARNNVLIARIPGSQFYYVDRDVPQGTWHYQVFGVIRGQFSRAAECTVNIPRDPIVPPRDLVCRYVGPSIADVEDPNASDDILPARFNQLQWVNGQRYTSIVIFHNGAPLVRLPGGSTSYRHLSPPPGRNHYQVFGVVGLRRSEAAECSVLVPIGRVPPVINLRCAVVYPHILPVDDVDIGDVGGVDVEPAPPVDDIAPLPRVRVILRWELPTTVRYDRIIISRNDVQIARIPGSSRSYTDHPPFLAGAATYCVVGVVDDRRSPVRCCDVTIEPPVLPPPQDFSCEVDPHVLDAAAPVPVVLLRWRNPVPYGRLVLSRDGVDLEVLPGDTMSYRDINPGVGEHVYELYGVAADGRRSRAVRCVVVVPPVRVPPVEDLTCVVVDTNAQGATAVLEWRSPTADYTMIWVIKDGDIVIQLPGDAQRYADRNLPPGVYRYEVIGWIDGVRSRGVECRVVVEGPAPRDLLYFSSGLFDSDPATGDVLPADPSGRITCLASNSRPIQGWSFGVCSDPSVLVPAEATIEGTTTARLNDGEGPSFLSLNRHEGGVTMGVVIDDLDPTDTLPSSTRHQLLRIRYELGPDGELGECYRVRYCDNLGSPPVAVLYVRDGFEVRPETAPGKVVIRDRGPQFIRGDFNQDLEVGMDDAIGLLRWLFNGGRDPRCAEAADANASRQTNIADAIAILLYLFSRGDPLPQPFPTCGSVPELFFGCEDPACPVAL